MDMLRGVVRSLVVLVIIMTFLEMLLPDNKLKKTASLIFGLMIIATLLNPIVVLLNNLGRASFDLSEFTFGENISYRDDEKTQGIFNQLTINQYLENIKDTTKDLIKPHIEGYEARIEVTVVTDFTSKDFGKLTSINVYLSKLHQGITPIKPVVIGKQDSREKFMEYENSTKIRGAITDYFKISDSVVKIYIEREEG